MALSRMFLIHTIRTFLREVSNASRPSNYEEGLNDSYVMQHNFNGKYKTGTLITGCSKVSRVHEFQFKIKLHMGYM